MNKKSASLRAKAQGNSVKIDPVTGKKRNEFNEIAKQYPANASLSEYAVGLRNPECLLVECGSVVEWVDPEGDGESEYARVERIENPKNHPLDYSNDPKSDDEVFLILEDGQEVSAWRDELFPVRERLQQGEITRDPFIVGVTAVEGSDLNASTYDLNSSKSALVKQGKGLYGPYDVTLFDVDEDGFIGPFNTTHFDDRSSVTKFLRTEAMPDENQRSLFSRAINMGSEQRVAMAVANADLNEGAWGDLADHALAFMSESDNKVDESADDAIRRTYEYVAPNRYDLTERHRRTPSVTDFRAASAVKDAAWALAHRHLVDDDSVTRSVSNYGQYRDGWTQEAYDHMTRPFRTVIGSVHPDDELTPESWSKRPGKSFTAPKSWDSLDSQ